MASAKDTFEAGTFGAMSFACGVWRGVGPSPLVGIWSNVITLTAQTGQYNLRADTGPITITATTGPYEYRADTGPIVLSAETLDASE